MAAVLEDACSVYSHPEPARSRSAQHLLVETEDWVASDEVSSWPFGFLRGAGLDPLAVRAPSMRGVSARLGRSWKIAQWSGRQCEGGRAPCRERR